LSRNERKNRNVNRSPPGKKHKKEEGGRPTFPKTNLRQTVGSQIGKVALGRGKKKSREWHQRTQQAAGQSLKATAENTCEKKTSRRILSQKEPTTGYWG